MGAIISYDKINKELILYSKLILYGSEATESIAQKIKHEIEAMYNEPHVEIMQAGINYSVVFKIDYEITSPMVANNLAKNNQDLSLNFIRIEDSNEVTRSFMGFGIGENSGHWITSDQLGDSTTVAHEFGHCLGLDHPLENDYRNAGSPPPIMAPRGTLVDAQYQWNPSVAAGEFGGTMKPTYRKVQSEEILNILLNVKAIDASKIGIGQLSNRIFDKLGGEILWA